MVNLVRSDLDFLPGQIRISCNNGEFTKTLDPSAPRKAAGMNSASVR